MNGLSVAIVHCTYESINTAIWLASLNHQVRMLADAQAVADVLANYKFDHQMSALWQMYTQSAQIVLSDDVHSLANASYVWLFLDGLSDAQRLRCCQRFDANRQQVILSGSRGIGEIATLAQELKGDNICYVPFVFMKDGAGFISLSSPDLLLIGEKQRNVHAHNELLLSLRAKTKKSHISDIKTIEFARSSIMAMLATRLSLMNEMARLADASDVDIITVQQVLGLDQRIGREYLSASWGFGGQTLPTEIALLDDFFAKTQVVSSLLPTVMQINEDQKELLFRKFWRYFDGFIDNKSVVIWGAGYRAGTGRTTNSAIHPLLRLLWSYQIKTQVYAPNAGFELAQMYGDEPLFDLIEDAYALQNADALFIINWSDVMPPEIDKLAQFDLPIFDGKNLLSAEHIAQLTGVYEGVGRHSHMMK